MGEQVGAPAAPPPPGEEHPRVQELVAELAERKGLDSATAALSPEAERRLAGLGVRSRCECGQRPVVAEGKCRGCLAASSRAWKERTVPECECGRGLVKVDEVPPFKFQRTHCAACLEEHRAAEEARRTELEEARRAHVVAHRAANMRKILGGRGVPMNTFQHRRRPIVPTFANFDPDPDGEALEAAKYFSAAYSRGERPILFLYSEAEAPPDEEPVQRRRRRVALAPGNGKSHLAAAIGAEMLNDPDRKEEDFRWIYMPALYADLQAATPGTMRQVLARHFDAPLTVLDDFGGHPLPEWMVAQIRVMIYEMREIRGHALVVTSNYGMDALAGRARGDAMAPVLSRLQEGALLPPPLVGPDRRGW